MPAMSAADAELDVPGASAADEFELFVLFELVGLALAHPATSRATAAAMASGAVRRNGARHLGNLNIRLLPFAKS
jgi:hypothetical protein